MNKIGISNVKQLFFIFILFSLILSVINITVEKLYFEDSAKKVALQNALKKTKEREGVVKNFLFQSEQTLISIRELDLFEQYLDNNSNEKTIANIFLSYSKSQTSFMQLRYIDKNGFEKIRIDRQKENTNPFIVPKYKLQNKENRYYFSDSKEKELEKVWFSALDLNIERGKVEIPYRPTIRAVLPIKNKGEFGGILIINYLMNDFLKKLVNAPLYDMILCNDKGYPLYHFEKNKSWGYYSTPKYLIKNDFPNHFKNILTKPVCKTDQFVSRKLDVDIYGGLNLILQLKASYLQEQQKQSNFQYLTISLITFLSSFLLTALIVKFFSKTLLNVEKLTKLNNDLNNASKIAKIGFWEYDAKTGEVEWSKGTYDLFEIEDYSISITYKKFLSYLPETDKQRVQNEFNLSISEKREYFINHKIITDKNNIKFVSQRAKHYYDSTGQLLKSVGSIHDISKQKEYEDRLKEQRKEYKQLLENSSDGIFIMSTKGKLIEFSDRAAKMLGYTKDEMKNLTLNDWEVSIPKNEIQNMLDAVTIEPVIVQTKHKRKDGSIYDTNITATRIIYKGEEVIYSSVRDITQQKNLEQKVLEQKEEFETIFRLVKDGIAITDLESNFLNCNDAFSKLTGYSYDEILTKSCKELTIEEDREKNEIAIQTAIEKGHLENIEKRCLNKNGVIYNVNMSITLLPDNKRLLLSIKDMTALKILEEQSKLASMGEMIGNIAHQWRQPLSIITTTASGLDMKAEYDEEISKEDISHFTDIVVKQAGYLSKTIDDFRNFIKGNVNYLPTSVKEALMGSLDLTKAARRENFLDTIINIEDDLTIYGNLNELEQSFINIINNAKDVLSQIDSDEDRYLFVSTKKIDENSLEIRFLDNAGGIKEEIIDKIFEPYFTTKHQSIGTGLGLSLVDKIIRQRHNGNITVHNEEYKYNDKKYKGACFVITFYTNKS
jgi:PAS domain S-box-containing protein